MANEEVPVTDIPGNKSVWNLVHNHLPGLIGHAIKQTGKGMFGDIMSKLGINVNNRLYKSLKNVGLGHSDNNDTVHHEVELAVSGAMHDLNITDDANSTLQNSIVSKLEEEIALDAVGQVIMTTNGIDSDAVGKVVMTTTENWRAQDFFHKMPMKDETLFVSMVCMGVIVPIIILTLFGIYMYKRRQDHKQRRQEMLLREFSMDDRTPEEHKGNLGEDVQDLDFRIGYQT